MENKEYFDIIDNNGKIIGKATRGECHGDNSLAHRVVHVLVFNSNGELFLQKRSMDKYIQPGKWDTSVGGHLDLGETFAEAVCREMKEELGMKDVPVQHLSKICLQERDKDERRLNRITESHIHFF